MNGRVAKPEKVELVSRVAEKLRASQSVILTDFKGMTVAQVTDLRSQLRKESIELKVVKNRLLRRAIAEAQCEALDDLLVGNTAVAYGVADATAPAKLLTQFAKTTDKLKIKGGLLERRRIDVAGVQNLAKMPGRRELLTMMARDLKQPATKVAGVMQAGLLKVAYAMQALARKQQGAGEPA